LNQQEKMTIEIPVSETCALCACQLQQRASLREKRSRPIKPSLMGSIVTGGAKKHKNNLNAGQ
jgi:hypothetical protein